VLGLQWRQSRARFPLDQAGRGKVGNRRPARGRSAVGDSGLIAATTTKTGLKVRCELDENSYPKAIRVTDDEMATLNIVTDTWHPEWNYTISPRPSK
jgi:hypothetical protein